MRVAVLGTGIMGAAMAKNIAGAGHDVVVWNRSRESAEATGLDVAGSPQEAVEGMEVAVTMLRDLDAVRETMDGVSLGDAVWMQSSTVGLGIEELSPLSDRLVDAPVLGTRAPAEAGKLTVLLSGPEELRRTLEPVAGAVGAKTIDLGDRIGAASRFKLAANAWVLMLTESTAELVALAQAADVDVQQLLGAFAGGPLDSGYMQQKAKAILDGDFEPQFKLETSHKDAGLIRELAARSGVDLAVVDALERRFGEAIDEGHGDEDMSATWYASRRRG